MAAAADDAAVGNLSADQAAVYDRQLRVWGVEVQRKLTASRVLLLGFGQLAAEIAKNITLAGVGSVALACDDTAAAHAGRNFLIECPPPADATASAAAATVLQAMNPLVQVSAAPGGIGGCSAPDRLAQYSLVVAAGLPLLQCQQLDEACTQAGVGFMAAAAPGPGGYFFLNLHQHAYVPKKGAASAGGAGASSSASASGEAAALLLRQQYAPMSDALSADVRALPASSHPLYLVLQVLLQQERRLGRPLAAADASAAREALAAAAAASGRSVTPAHEQMLDAFVQRTPEFAPVCAVLGGVAANNIIRAVSHSGAPVKNLFYYTLFDGQQGLVEDMPPPSSAKAAPAAAAAAAAQPGQPVPPSSNGHHASAAAAAAAEVLLLD